MHSPLSQAEEGEWKLKSNSAFTRHLVERGQLLGMLLLEGMVTTSLTPQPLVMWRQLLQNI
jgi:hypothetical protein